MSSVNLTIRVSEPCRYLIIQKERNVFYEGNGVAYRKWQLTQHAHDRATHEGKRRDLRVFGFGKSSVQS